MPVLTLLETDPVSAGSGNDRKYYFKGSPFDYVDSTISSTTGIKPVTKARIIHRLPDLLQAGVLIAFSVTMEKTGKRKSNTLYCCSNKDISKVLEDLIGKQINGATIVRVSGRTRSSFISR